MEDRVSIVTPDHIELDFELAGIGSRLLALILDQLLVGLLLVALVIMGLVTGIGGSVAKGSQWAGAWTAAMIVLLVFAVMWGYRILFEALHGGQTPGKKWTGIRVVRDDGLPVGWREAALRNLAVAADMLPPPACIVGGLMIVLSRRGKRLGDLLAGTMVVREDSGFEPRQRASRWGAAWIVRVERGRSRRGMMLGDVKIDTDQIQIIERFLTRRDSLPSLQRQTIAWRIARPFLSAMGEDPTDLAQRPDRFAVCERVLKDIMSRADATPQASSGATADDAADAKRRQWQTFDGKMTDFAKAGRRGLRRLGPDDLSEVMEEYRRLACDLARARSMGQSSAVVRHLNNIAVRAHNVLYGHIRSTERMSGIPWVKRFPIAVRAHLAAVVVSAALLFGPAVISYVAVQLHPALGYDLVAGGFLDFEPARPESLHEIPSLARPFVASSILTNNIQVTLLAFGLGLTAGVGTSLLLIFNGVHLGAVAGWMTAKGNSGALWGWIMPHGGTELLAITLSGGAGFVLARAIIAPGEFRRATALRQVAMNALIIELGVMVMLIFAGLIEGFVSPSRIGFTARIAVLVATLTFWVGYLSLVGLRSRGMSEE